MHRIRICTCVCICMRILCVYMCMCTMTRQGATSPSACARRRPTAGDPSRRSHIA